MGPRFAILILYWLLVCVKGRSDSVEEWRPDQFALPRIGRSAIGEPADFQEMPTST
jgi:hypothetical protein